MTDESSPNHPVASYKIGDNETILNSRELHLICTYPDYPISPVPYRAALSAGNQFRKKVLYLSSEQSVEEVAQQLIIHNANLDTETTKNNMNKRDWGKLKASVGKLLSIQISIDHIPDMSMDEIDARCRMILERDGLDIVIINSIKDHGSEDLFARICMELGPLCYELGMTVFICMKNGQPD